MSFSICDLGAAPRLRLITVDLAAMLSVRISSMSSFVCRASSTPGHSLSAMVEMCPRYPPVVSSFPALQSSLWHAKELWLALPQPSEYASLHPSSSFSPSIVSQSSSHSLLGSSGWMSCMSVSGVLPVSSLSPKLSSSGAAVVTRKALLIVSCRPSSWGP